MNFSILTDNYELFLKGLWVTFYMVSISLIMGLLFSLPLAWIRHAKVPFFNRIIQLYTYFFRGTPLLLQVYLIYYGSGQFDWIKDSFLWIFLKEAYLCGLLAFTLNTCAYTTEIIHGALNTVPKKEIEAARAFGMNETQIILNIVFPNALRRSIPPYSNEVIFMFHGSAIASVITITDLTGAARYLYAKFYDPFTPFVGAGLIYLVLVFCIVWAFKKLEVKYMSHLKSR